MVDRASRHNPFLFEHNWRKQPVRLWLETVVRALRPGRFWQRESLSRCRARAVHTLRIVAYAAGPVGLLYGGGMAARAWL